MDHTPSNPTGPTRSFQTLQTRINTLILRHGHVSKQNVHTQEPNLQTVKAVVNGVAKRIRVCTSCIKAGKVTKA
jgi:ribosomal protein L28